MKMKKLLNVLLLITIIMIQFTGIVYAIGEETTPPSFVSVVADKSILKAGETIKFNIVAEDDSSGVNSFFIEWKLKEDESKTMSKQYNSMTDVGIYEYILPENTAAGNWQATYIGLYDNLQNIRSYYRNNNNLDDEIMSKFDFEVEDSQQDVEPPVVSNVRRITGDFVAPGEVKIQYDVVDDKSGVQQYSGGVTYCKEKSPSDTTSVNMVKVDENTYESTFYLDSQYKKYIFSYIQVCDNAGNWKNYTAEELGITNELDITPTNYIEDKTAPKLTSIEYDTREVQIPDYVEIILNVEENESGLGAFIGKAYFKSDDGRYSKETIIQSATDSNGTIIHNKGKVRLDFGNMEIFRGNIYLYKVELQDIMGNIRTYSIDNNNLKKEEISISKVEKSYTLITSTTKQNYINEIASLPEGSTVLCNVLRGNQIIEKELFDAIKGKDITITFMSLYSANWEITSTTGEISTSDTNTGIQWIINGKDVINETKDVDMKITISKELYSKYIIPEYQIDKNLEMDYWDKEYSDDLTMEEFESKIATLREIQKTEIKDYFERLKAAGYQDVDTACENTIKLIEETDGEGVCEGYIMDANDYIEYLSIKFAENGTLPCKTLIRMKPTYALRALIGAKDLSLYYVDGDDYSLIDNDVKVDSEKYYNFTLYHNSEYRLTNAKFEKLAKVDKTTNNDKELFETTNNNKVLDETPKTGETDYVGIISMFSMISLAGIMLLKRK